MKKITWAGSLGASSLTIALALFGTASANTWVCDVQDATANGGFADQCLSGDPSPPNVDSETNFVNGEWGPDLEFVGKWDFTRDTQDEVVDGYEFTVSLFSTEQIEDGDNEVLGVEYKFAYSLVTNPSQAGQTVDWVLGIKQAAGSAPADEDPFVAYLWLGIELDIVGTFNNFFTVRVPQGPNQGRVNSVENIYSHASGWLRFADEPPPPPPPQQIPEPGSLALVGGGLLVLGWALRRRMERPSA